MARIDNLTNNYTDIADAIRQKTGKTETIKPQDFDTEILSIESGGSGGLQISELEYVYQVASTLANVDRYDQLEVAYSNSKDNFTLDENGVITSYNEASYGHILDIVIPIGTKDTGDWEYATKPFKKTNYTSLTLPYGLTNIGDLVFRDFFVNEQQLIIPNSVITIGSNAFFSWHIINQQLILSNSLISIGGNAFAYWLNNTYPVTIPNSVTSIGYSAFADWTSATAFIIERTIPPTLGSDAFDNSNDAPIYVPDLNVDDYKEATGWIAYADRIFPISDRG